MKTAVPMTLSAMGQKAAGGDTSAARLILQTAGLVGSGGTEVHVGDRIRNQLNVHGQQPQAHGDHRDIVFRAANAAEFEITVEIGNMMAAEMLAREERGEPALTDEQQLRSIKIATEKVISQRADNAIKAEAADAPMIDVTPTEQG